MAFVSHGIERVARLRLPYALAAGPVAAAVVIGSASATAAAGTAIQAPRPGSATTTQLPLSGVDRASLTDLASAAPSVPSPLSVSPLLRVASPQADSGSTTGDPTVLTAPRATAAFDVVGITWDDPAAPVELVQVRTRTDGVWSDWQDVEIDDAAPDPGTAEAAHARPGTEPLVQTGSDGLQVRVDTRDGAAPTGLTATLVDGGAADGDLDEVESATPPATAEETVDAVGMTASATRALSALTTTAEPMAAAPDAQAAPGAGYAAARLAPPIVTRAQWGADESIRKPIDWNTTIQAVVVHHTVNANDYTEAQVPAIVRSIYEYHVKGRGWSDVGYHFLVDRFGNVYEGRKGSIDKIPLGVHTGGFNTNTIGIAVIGRFDQGVAPSEAAVSSVAQVAAWKLGTYGRDPLGTVTMTAGSGSTHAVRKPGWTGPIDVISGHRDLGATACPGTKLYARLGDIRTKAAQLIALIRAVPVTTYAVSGAQGVSGRYYAASGIAWTATVTSVCATTPARTWSGTGSRYTTVTWDLKDGAGRLVAPGVYQMTITRTVSGTVVADSFWVESLPPPGDAGSSCGVSRLAGADRSGTAVELGRVAFPDAKAVVIVSGAQASLVDGLVAAPFARSIGAPVLLGQVDGLPAATAAEVRRRGATQAWLVGGTGVLGDAVEAQLTALGVQTVQRLAGPDRNATAEAVAAQLPASSGAVVASGNDLNLVDAAAAGGVAAATGRPILLTVRGGGLTDKTLAVLQARGVDDVTVVGGSGAVSDDDVDRVAAATGAVVTRLGGADRYQTALLVTQAFAGTVGADRVLMASGADASLVDSLTGGELGQLTVLVPGPSGLLSVDTWLGSVGTTHVDVAGGPGAVSTAAVVDLVGALS